MKGKTKCDVNNVVVKVVLTELGKKYNEKYWPQMTWRDYEMVVKNVDIFGDECAYCGKKGANTWDHVTPMNLTDCGLHAFGNVVPACGDCNGKKLGKNWTEFLRNVCGTDESSFQQRQERIACIRNTFEYDPEKSATGEREQLKEQLKVRIAKVGKLLKVHGELLRSICELVLIGSLVCPLIPEPNRLRVVSDMVFPPI